MFQPWPHLPTELKLEVLQHALRQPDPIAHSAHLENLRASQLSFSISTRNRELSQLALDACESILQFICCEVTDNLLDYKSNTFLITPHILRTTFGSRSRLFRPRTHHAQKIQRLVFRLTTCFPQQKPLQTSTLHRFNAITSIFFRQDQPWVFILALGEHKKHNFFDCHITDDAISARAEWQNDFTSLKSFTLDLQLSGKYSLDPPIVRVNAWGNPIASLPSACTCRSQEEVMQILACGRTNIRVKNIIVTATVDSCRNGAREIRLVEVLQSILSGNDIDLAT